jgi:hypothetical protein
MWPYWGPEFEAVPSRDTTSAAAATWGCTPVKTRHLVVGERFT